jgi:hypothetical protein
MQETALILMTGRGIDRAFTLSEVSVYDHDHYRSP